MGDDRIAVADTLGRRRNVASVVILVVGGTVAADDLGEAPRPIVAVIGDMVSIIDFTQQVKGVVLARDERNAIALWIVYRHFGGTLAVVVAGAGRRAVGSNTLFW